MKTSDTILIIIFSISSMKNLIKICTLFLLLSIYSCASKENYQEIMGDVVAEKALEIKADKSLQSDQRKIIRDGRITFETTNVKLTNALIKKAVKEFNAYIASENEYSYNDRIEHQLVLRVPAENFDILLTKISGSVEKLESKNIELKDVTEQYIDLETRIKTKKELETRYTALLKKAKTVKEILAIEEQIGKLREEIESVEGRLKLLKDRTAFSTLTITYYQDTKSPFGFSAKFVKAINNGWDNLLWFIIGIIHIWPFVLIVAAAIYFAFKLDKRRKIKK